MIYITQQKKEELEAKLKTIRINDQDEYEDKEDYLLRKFELEQNFIDEILSEAIILPEEESWYSLQEKVENDSQSLILQVPFICKSLYPSGVIINPKK